MTSPQPFTSTVTPLCLSRFCNSPLRGYITSGLGAKTTSGDEVSPRWESDSDEGRGSGEGGGGRRQSFSDTPRPRTERLDGEDEVVNDAKEEEVGEGEGERRGPRRSRSFSTFRGYRERSSVGAN